MLKKICGFFLLTVARWRLEGNLPDEPKQYVVIAAPHTSNWDFVYAMLLKGYWGIKVTFLGKAELFRPPFGWLFRSLGVLPVDRSKHSNTVAAAVDLFKQDPNLRLALAPEGTRAFSPQWKTGFYHIAVAANVPIIMTLIDYEHRVLKFTAPYYPTGDEAVDFEFIAAQYRGIKGKYPELGTYSMQEKVN